jgi:sec-independent protein translocase protein TatA
MLGLAKPRVLGLSGRRCGGRLGGVTDLGWPELLIVAAIAMMLFGTKKMPDVARSIGRSMRIVKAELGGLRDEDPGTPEPAPATAPAQPATGRAAPAAGQSAPAAFATATPAAPAAPTAGPGPDGSAARPLPSVVPPTDAPIR